MGRQEKDQKARATKQFWAVTDQWEVKLVTGYECPPGIGVWWVPELGYSLHEKDHLFKTADGARCKAIDDLNKRITILQAALSKLHLENQ